MGMYTHMYTLLGADEDVFSFVERERVEDNCDVGRVQCVWDEVSGQGYVGLVISQYRVEKNEASPCVGIDRRSLDQMWDEASKAIEYETGRFVPPSSLMLITGGFTS